MTKAEKLRSAYPLIFKYVAATESAIYEMPKSDFLTLFGHLSFVKNSKIESDTVKIKYTIKPAGGLREMVILSPIEL